MTSDPTVRRPSAARLRVLETASRLFYAEGVHTVGIDRIIAEAGVAKATFYKHFPGKDDLVCAYLAEQSRLQRALVAAARSGRRDPLRVIAEIFAAIAETGCGPGFRGCAFVNAAVEYPDPAHAVRQVVTDHRLWFHGVLTELLAEAGRSAALADLLMIVRDGLVVGSTLDDPAAVRAGIDATVAGLLARS